jgi:hypothetical protein
MIPYKSECGAGRTHSEKIGILTGVQLNLAMNLVKSFE